VTGLLLLFAFAPPDAYQRGIQALNENRLEDAVALLRQAVAQQPANAQYWKALGVALAKGEDYRSSIEPFAKACSLSERLPDACYYHGRGLYAVDRYDEALAPLEKALRVDPAKSRAEAALGQALEALGRYQEAERRLQSAVARRDAYDRQARIAYSQFLRRQGRPEESVAVLQAVSQPAGDDYYYELSLSLFQAERYADALKALEQAAGHPDAAQLRDRVRRRLAAQ